MAHLFVKGWKVANFDETQELLKGADIKMTNTNTPAVCLLSLVTVLANITLKLKNMQFTPMTSAEHLNQ